MSAKNAPERIYLQDEDDGLEEYQDVGGRTWCEDKINEGDIEYVRADLLPRWVSVEEGLPENGWRGLTYNAEWGQPKQVLSYLHGVGGSRNAWIGDDGDEIDPDGDMGEAEPTHYLSNVPPIPNTEER